MLCWHSKYSLSTTFYQDFASKYFRGTRCNSAISYQKCCTWKWMRCLKTLSCIPLFYLVELFECKCVCYYHFLSTDIKWINCVFLFYFRSVALFWPLYFSFFALYTTAVSGKSDWQRLLGKVTKQEPKTQHVRYSHVEEMGVDQPLALGVRAFFQQVLKPRCTNAYFVKKDMEFCLYGSFYSTV